jgi:hypothetical protein
MCNSLINFNYLMKLHVGREAVTSPVAEAL